MDHKTVEDLLTLMSMEVQEDPRWPYDNNTTVLLITIKNMQSLLQAALIVSEDFTKMEEVNWSNFIAAVARGTTWIIENMEVVKK